MTFSLVRGLAMDYKETTEIEAADVRLPSETPKSKEYKAHNMGLFWDLMQQSQLNEQENKAVSLEAKVSSLERELRDTRQTLHKLITVLETEFGKDFNADGKIG